MRRSPSEPGDVIVATRRALRQRLLVAAEVLFPPPSEADALSTSALIHELALVAKRSPDLHATWLLHVALVGVLPEQEQVHELRRRLELSSDGAVIVAALHSTVDLASREGGSLRTMRIESERTLVDVNFCATYDHNTGLQRVVRKTMPYWAQAGHPVEFVAWTHDGDGYRALSDEERERVLNWDERQKRTANSGGRTSRRKARDAVQDGEVLIVPWRTMIVVPEVPFQHLCRKIAAAASLSGNVVSLVGYDAIPLVSADSQPLAESERFAHYLTIVKHAHLVVGISESASGEFAGFRRALTAQGLPGPQIATVPLAREAPLAPPKRARPESAPLVLCVGSHEPRKNQDAVLYAAENLHAEGLNFEMVFVGGGSRSAIHHFDSRVRSIRRRGFAVRSLRGTSDQELVELYDRARFSVFVSLHEGYGLPVVESLHHGTPVLTSNYGSLAEIARLGGCVLVDPRDDSQILEAMRRMLIDDELIGRLRGEADSIPERPWSVYAAELWNAITATVSVPAA